MTSITIFVCLAGLCSGIIKTGVGIGAGIFLLPTLCLAFPAKLALGLGAPMMLVSDIIGLKFYWKQWADKRTLLRLLGSALPGLIVGAVLLPMIPGKAFQIGVGIFGTLYAVFKLWPSCPPAMWLKGLFESFLNRHEEKSCYFYGFLGGLSTVLAHAGGLVWSMYLVKAVPDRRLFVGTTIFMFFLTNIYKFFSYIYIDILSISDLYMILPALPMMIIGSYVGNKLNLKANNDLFRKIVLVVILILSLMLIF